MKSHKSNSRNSPLFCDARPSPHPAPQVLPPDISSAKGAFHTSLGQRPRKRSWVDWGGLKARINHSPTAGIGTDLQPSINEILAPGRWPGLIWYQAFGPRHAPRISWVRTHPHGFTLIELLVVIAIIAILASLSSSHFGSRPPAGRTPNLCADTDFAGLAWVWSPGLSRLRLPLLGACGVISALVRAEPQPPEGGTPNPANCRPNAFGVFRLWPVPGAPSGQNENCWANQLLPSLSKAKAIAQTSACLNNLKQLQLGWTLYSGDHNDSLPPNHEHFNAGGQAGRRSAPPRG